MKKMTKPQRLERRLARLRLALYKIETVGETNPKDLGQSYAHTTVIMAKEATRALAEDLKAEMEQL